LVLKFTEKIKGPIRTDGQLDYWKYFYTKGIPSWVTWRMSDKKILLIKAGSKSYPGSTPSARAENALKNLLPPSRS
jgi:hypothetical protein